MKIALIQQKIKAYLHDPLHKALMLMQTSEKHQDVAQRLARLVGVTLHDGKDIALADQLASAADRFLFPDDRQLMTKFLDNPVLTHPFSGAQKDFSSQLNSSIRDEIIRDAQDAVETTLKHYAELLNSFTDPETKTEGLYWLLWRRFNSDVQHAIQHDGVRSIWPFLPADTRIPDHGLWNHLKITAALSACIVEREEASKAEWIDAAFLLFSLGPVQSFIATARKTLDHWMGSFLLSYLTFTAMQAVFEEIGADAIVFPELHEQPFMDAFLASRFPKIFQDITPKTEQLLIPSLPNRFLAIVPTGLARELAEKAEKAVKKEWEAIWKSGKTYFEKKVGIASTPYWEHLWQRQCTDFFEIYWLVLPWKRSFREQRDFYKEWVYAESPIVEGDPDILKKIDQFYDLKLYEHPSNLALAYPLIYELAEHLFGARKNWRYYQSSQQQGEPSFKCHLCGEREVLHLDEPKVPGYYQQFHDVVNHQDEGQKFYRGKDGWRQIQDFWEKGILKKREDENYTSARMRKFFKQRERLCAVCATKRVAEFYFQEKFADMGIPINHRDFAYPSTAEIAGATLKRQIIQKAAEQPKVIDDFLTNLKTIAEDDLFQTNTMQQLIRLAANKPSLQQFVRLDAAYLFNLLDEPTMDEISEALEVDQQKAHLKNALSQLFTKLDISRSKLNKYYCYLAMDGDKMGDWVAGKFLPAFDKVIHPHVVEGIKNASDEKNKKIASILKDSRRITPSIHSMLSRVQNQFALQIARQVVEDANWGKLVYAGGDDVLAMMPVSEGLKIAHQLRLAFSGYEGRLGEGNGWVLKENGKLQMVFGSRASASLGLVIAHHTMPMGRVISRAQQMEKKAKKFGRDALGLALLKRSGEIVQTVVPFSAPEDTDVVKDVLIPLHRWIASGEVSRDFVYVLKMEASGFSDDAWEMFEIEMKRIFERKIKKKEHKPQLVTEFDRWRVAVGHLHQELKSRFEATINESTSTSHNQIIQEILNTFSIIEFMARESLNI